MNIILINIGINNINNNFESVSKVLQTPWCIAAGCSSAILKNISKKKIKFSHIL